MKPLPLTIALYLVACSPVSDAIDRRAKQLSTFDIDCAAYELKRIEAEEVIAVYQVRKPTPGAGFVPAGEVCATPAPCYLAEPGEPVSLVAPIDTTGNIPWDAYTVDGALERGLTCVQ